MGKMEDQTQLKSHKVTFPDELYIALQIRLRQTGLSVPEYLRHLVLNDVKPIMDESIEYLDEKTEARLGEAMEDIKAGRVYPLRTKEDFDKLFDGKL